MGARQRDVRREEDKAAVELGLLDNDLPDDRIIDFMIEHLILVNRPIVVTPLGTLLARPSEAVLSVLDRKPVSFTKEDGEVVELG